MRRALLLLAALCVIGSSAAEPAAAQARHWDSPGPCDRSCLIDILDTYLAALVASDPAAAPLSPNLRFTENTELMNRGQGLWETASALPTSFAIPVPDPVARQIGFIGMMEEAGNPVQVGIRLKIDDGGRITEAEHLVVRNLGENSLANLQTPRPGLLATIPPDERLPRELMLMIGQTYYDSIEQSDGDASLFADECERRENGMVTAGGGGIGMDGLPRLGCREHMFTRTFTYIDSIDLRRVWIADVETGLVFALSQFRHSMRERNFPVFGRDGELTTRTVNFNPFDLPAAHILKIRNSRIHEIEALGFQMPYMSGNGWSQFLR
jgi:hypothetical protein